MIDKLNAKKTALVAQRDQLNANLNATLGAIAICEELIAEAVSEQIAAKAAAKAAAAEQIDVTSVDDAEPVFVPACPEMLPVQPEEIDETDIRTYLIR